MLTVLCAVCLSGNAVPDLVVLGQQRVDLVGRERVVDVGLVAAAVAGVG